MILDTFEDFGQFTLLRQQGAQFFHFFLLVLVCRAKFIESLRSNLRLGVRFLKLTNLFQQALGFFPSAAGDEVPEPCVDKAS